MWGHTGWCGKEDVPSDQRPTIGYLRRPPRGGGHLSVTLEDELESAKITLLKIFFPLYYFLHSLHSLF